MATWSHRTLQALTLRARSEGAALLRARCRDCSIVPPVVDSLQFGCPVRCGVAVTVAAAPSSVLAPPDAAGIASALHCAELALMFHRLGTREVVLVGDALLARSMRNAVRHGGYQGADLLARAVARATDDEMSEGSTGDWNEHWYELYRTTGAPDCPTLRDASQGVVPHAAWQQGIGVEGDMFTKLRRIGYSAPRS